MLGVRPKPTRSAASHKPTAILKSPRFRFLPTSAEIRHSEQDFAQFPGLDSSPQSMVFASLDPIRNVIRFVKRESRDCLLMLISLLVVSALSESKSMFPVNFYIQFSLRTKPSSAQLERFRRLELKTFHIFKYSVKQN